ncbi:hypothetical protein QM716_21880 [Rhodococcus sp. IEGM 1409]|uniref:hypothetical protein n=1 Tax=Rhodococcus sp. IEGM 1409 TaxID=3047082 RepID=UPI0024B806A0|nr:hypothetical protein [Rhodococcus sp. IEGM 1409]MDI9902511.1 hypothetical protein [Rhodococcus sp. IEGM 1409]
MTVSLARRAGTAAAISAAACGLVLAATVPASAHNVTTNYNNACMGDPVSLIAGNVHQPLQAHSMSVAHSSSTPGTYTIQPGSQTVPTSGGGATVINLNRLNLVFKIDPATYTSASIVSGTGSGFSGTPVVTRVNASGAADATGSYLSLNGGVGTTIAGASPGGSNTSDAGLTALAGATFTLPSVQVVTTSPNPAVYINTDGDAGKYANPKNYMTFLSKASLFGTQYAPTMCSATDVTPRTDSNIGSVLTPNGGAANLHP